MTAPGPVRPRRRRTTWLIVAGVLLLIVGLAIRWALPPVRLPAPMGEYAVGTTTVEWVDPARAEPATEDRGDHRFVVTQLWYPAAPDASGSPSWYLGRDADEAKVVATGIADTFGMPALVLGQAARAHSPAVADVPAVRGEERFPLVLFSPGLQGVRQQNTAWATELASHGYVVAALDHPYDSAIVVRTDSTAVSSTVTATGDDAEDQRRADAWTAIRAADLRFVLTQLTAMDRGRLPENRAQLAGRLDLSRVGVAGHSLGGAAAIQAAVLDDRFRSVIDIDGFPRLPEPGAHHPPVLALVAGRGTGSDDGDRRYADAVTEVLSRSTRPSFRLVVPRAGHLSFTDAALYLPPLPSLFGTGGRSATIEVTERASMAFLEATLNGGDHPTLAQQLAELGEVTEFGR